MEYATLKDALDGLYAYDCGSLDSGIRDQGLKAEVGAYLDSLDDRDRMRLLSKIARDLYLSDEAIEQGYGLTDVNLFYDWLVDQHWWD